ncbi:MAG: hypothetical protein ACE5ES_05690 [Candidatus Nanoarchaeia archaeon]
MASSLDERIAKALFILGVGVQGAEIIDASIKNTYDYVAPEGLLFAALPAAYIIIKKIVS